MKNIHAVCIFCPLRQPDYNYVSRLYSADVGRFPQPDSILPDVFGPQALSRYSYVSNNPTNFTDPTGHFGSGVYPVGPMPGGGGGDPVLPPGYDDADSPSVPSQPGGDYLVCEPHGTIMRSLGRADNRSWWVGYGALRHRPMGRAIRSLDDLRNELWIF
ncbi:MAG: hypothetical protein E6I38_11590 [Chloroflexi bacterium]|nr:MAG: hypothetical protein E6I38_11590 [Chloroflexota bacterium]